jgi:SAM-dependent methyltransferase
VFEADALALPITDRSLNLITVAFGFRNLATYEAGLREMRRVLRPGGVAAILEFSQPTDPNSGLFSNIYCHRILPIVGGFLTGSKTHIGIFRSRCGSFHRLRNWPKECKRPGPIILVLKGLREESRRRIWSMLKSRMRAIRLKLCAVWYLIFVEWLAEFMLLLHDDGSVSNE